VNAVSVELDHAHAARSSRNVPLPNSSVHPRTAGREWTRPASDVNIILAIM
jgi:hypothetical protein